MIENPLWSRLLESVKTRINRQNFDIWFMQLRLVGGTEHELILEVPNRQFHTWIRDNYQDLILSELDRLAGHPVGIQIVYPGQGQSPENAEDEGESGGTQQPAAQRPLGFTDHAPSPPQRSQGAASEVHVEAMPSRRTSQESGPTSTFLLNPDQTFSTFVVGSGNQFAHAAALAAADKPGQTYNPLFLFGSVGVGKTHLLNAIGNQILSTRPNARILYLSTEQFTNEMVNSLRMGNMNEFRNTFRDSCDALLLDDIQFLAGKVRTQDEFFFTFNALHSSGKQIAVSADKFPREIQGLEERLRNRFEWGMIADIQPPDMETKAAILKEKAIRENVILPDDVALYIASNTQNNVRELEGVLIRLSAAATFYRQSIDLNFTHRVLRDVLDLNRPSITVDVILEQVSRFYDVKVQDLKSAKKHKQIVVPRQVAMYLCRQLTSSSFPEIGAKIGGRDHTTVIHAVNKIGEALEKDPELRSRLKDLERSLGVKAP